MKHMRFRLMGLSIVVLLLTSILLAAVVDAQTPVPQKTPPALPLPTPNAQGKALPNQAQPYYAPQGPQGSMPYWWLYPYGFGSPNNQYGYGWDPNYWNAPGYGWGNPYWGNPYGNQYGWGNQANPWGYPYDPNWNFGWGAPGPNPPYGNPPYGNPPYGGNPPSWQGPPGGQNQPWGNQPWGNQPWGNQPWGNQQPFPPNWLDPNKQRG